MCNRYEDVISRLLTSFQLLKTAPKIVIVADHHDRSYGYDIVPYTEDHFVFAAAANLGINALEGLDVVLINDDTWFVDCTVLDRLSEFAHSGAKLGIVSPLIMGCAGNRIQRFHEREQWWRPNEPWKIVPVESMDHLCFPFIYLRRDMLNEVGLLNENYREYGGDDRDLCLRARKYGWRMGVLGNAIVGHGDGSSDLAAGWGRSWSTSFARRWPDGCVPTS